jgi:hypothetical protein
MYDWCVRLYCDCTIPTTVWYLCTMCVRQKTQMKSHEHLIAHYRKSHRESKKRKCIDDTRSSLVDTPVSSDVAVHNSTLPLFDGICSEIVNDITVPPRTMPCNGSQKQLSWK